MMRFILPGLIFSLAAFGAFYPVNRGMINTKTKYTVDGSTITLPATGNQVHLIEGLDYGNIFRLPNAQNLPNDWWYESINNSTGTVTYSNQSGTAITTVAAGRALRLILDSNATANGSWKFYLYPSIAEVESPAITVGDLSIVDDLVVGGDVLVTGSTTLTVPLGVPSGGSGLSTIPQGGQLLIGNGTSYSLAVPTAGQGIQVVTGSGTLTVSASAEPLQIGTIDAQAKSANGLVTASNVLHAQTAEAAFPGLVSTGNQQFSGNKTFLGTPNFDTVTASRFLRVDGSKNLTSSLVNLANTTTDVSGTLAVGNGGLGITSTPTNGQIPIGNGTNYTASTLTAGSNITITNTSGAITVSASGGSSGTPYAWQGAHQNGCNWDISSTSYVTPATDTSCTFAQKDGQNYNSFISAAGGVYDGGGLLSGITVTPSQSGVVKVCATVASTNDTANSRSTLRLTENSVREMYSNPVGQGGSAGAVQSSPLCGFATVTASTSVTYMIQGARNSGAMTLGNAGIGNIIEWSIEMLK